MMNILVRISAFYFLILLVAIISLLNVFYDEIKPSFRQSSEEIMVETANLLAEILQENIVDNQHDFSHLDEITNRFNSRNPNANIWSHLKVNTNLSFYITDQYGIVTYHSSNKDEIGKDYSQWRDVKLTLNGEYGARTTRKDPNNELTSEMYVAAPILENGDIAGVVTIIQHYHGLLPFIGKTEKRLVISGTLLLLVLVIAGLLLVFWYNRMLTRLTKYVEKVRSGDKVEEINFKDKNFNQLSHSLHKMREELDGKLYIENYIHTLTHELKSPLSAISAASELLQTQLNEQKRIQFTNNIEAEVDRLKQIIDQLLLLASLENNQEKELCNFSIKTVLDKQTSTAVSQCENRDVLLTSEIDLDDDLKIHGNDFLISIAVSNLLTNAIEFCNGKLSISAIKNDNHIQIKIMNTSEHIPDYAKERLFERFFSTPRPDTGRKSSGLGLCLVKHIAEIHDGEIFISNIMTKDGKKAVLAEFTLPL